MYHGLGGRGAATTASEGWFVVPAPDFVAQMRQIRALGFAGLSIAQALESRGPRVAISFDDGLASDYEVAFPALVDLGMTATFFVVRDWVGRPGYATWNQLREMHAAGMSIQSHTVSHPFLSELGRERLWDELTRSREEIEQRLGAAVTQLALPGGDAPRRALRPLLAEAGYRLVATSRWGANAAGDEAPTRWVLRCTVAGAVAPARFADVVRGSASVSRSRWIRERLLGALRRTLGPSRYARIRRRVLDAVVSRPAAPPTERPY